jgi:hypothetical protein
MLIALRFVVLTAIVGLGVTAGVHYAWTQTYGVGVCRSKDCKKYTPFIDPTCEQQGKQKKCIFDTNNQKGTLIYCDETTGKCELEDGPMTNNCTGGCEDNLGKSCFSIFYNKCKGAVPE